MWSEGHVTNEQEPIKVSCHPANFGGHRHSGSVDILVVDMIFASHMNLM